MCWFVRRGKVSEVQPVPRRNQDVFSLDVAVKDVSGMTVPYSAEKLEREPFLLNFF